MKKLIQFLTIVFTLILFTNLLLLTKAPAETMFSPCDGENLEPSSHIPSTGTIKSLTIFAKFKGTESGLIAKINYDVLNPNIQGSAAHYLSIMSNYQHKLVGDIYPEIIESDHTIDYYGCSGFGAFNQEIFDKIDSYVNFAQYDGNGDGLVDNVSIVIKGVPWPDPTYKFFNCDNPYSAARASLGTGDAKDGVIIKAGHGFTGRGSGDDVSGTLYDRSSGFVHEYGHMMGLPDLYDKSFEDDPALHSAGLGSWCPMAMAWAPFNQSDPRIAPLCAYCRIKIGWEIPAIITYNYTVDFAPPNSDYGNRVYKLPVPNSNQYFLVENIQNQLAYSNYYYEKLPASGLAIWHIDPSKGGSGSKNEKRKFVDLECADGLYSDKGYPSNRTDTEYGGDNLDFWSGLDPKYSRYQNGNTGDNTDLFTQGKYFSKITNPSSKAYDSSDKQTIHTNIAVTNIKNGTNGTIKAYLIIQLDNTAPAKPTGVTISKSSCRNSISWNKNTEIDLAGYNVYKSATKIRSLTTSTSITDYDCYSSCYSITSVDVNGNESLQSSNCISVSSTSQSTTLSVPGENWFFIECGDPYGSSNLIYRDGYYILDEGTDYTVDYAEKQLIYKIDGLDVKKNYMISAIFYTPTGTGKKTQTLEIDDTSIISDFDVPNEPIELTEKIPKQMYKNDGSITITITKKKGLDVVVSAIYVYEK